MLLQRRSIGILQNPARRCHTIHRTEDGRVLYPQRTGQHHHLLYAHRTESGLYSLVSVFV